MTTHKGQKLMIELRPINNPKSASRHCSISRSRNQVWSMAVRRCSLSTM